jgi:hypothetical protein
MNREILVGDGLVGNSTADEADVLHPLSRRGHEGSQLDQILQIWRSAQAALRRFSSKTTTSDGGFLKEDLGRSGSGKLASPSHLTHH